MKSAELKGENLTDDKVKEEIKRRATVAVQGANVEIFYNNNNTARGFLFIDNCRIVFEIGGHKNGLNLGVVTAIRF